MVNFVRNSCLMFLLYLVVIPVFGPQVIADEIILENGDRVSGKLKLYDQKRAIISTSYAGDVTIAGEKINTLVTDTYVVVVFDNSDMLTGRIRFHDENKLQIQTEGFGTFGPFRLERIKRITRREKDPALRKLVATAKSPLSADLVHLRSGDRLFGTIKEINAQELLLHTDYAGEIKLPRNSITIIATKDAVTIVLKNSEYITGRIYPSSNNLLQIKSGRSGTSGQFQLSDIIAIYRGDPADILRARQEPKFNGRVNIGINVASGNSDKESYHADGRIRARTPKNRYTVGAEFNREKSDGEETANNVLGLLKYDHFFKEKWFLFNSATFEHDKFKDLNLRTSLGLGVGHQFFETLELVLSAEGGLTYVNEDFDMAEDEAYPGFRWALEYEHGVLKWVRLFHNHELLMGTDVEDILVRTRSGLRLPLAKKFNATVEMDFDWDRSPAEGSTSTDKKYIFSLGYEW